MGANLARAELQEGLAFLAPRMRDTRAGRRAGVRHDHRPVRDALPPGALGRVTAGLCGLNRRSSGYTPGAQGWSTGEGSEGKRRVFICSVWPGRFTAARGPGRVGLCGRVAERRQRRKRAARRSTRPATACTRRSGRTSHGIPHILAVDFAGPGLRLRLRRAKENICVLAETYVTANARAVALLRSRRLVHPGRQRRHRRQPQQRLLLPAHQGQGHDRGPARAGAAARAAARDQGGRAGLRGRLQPLAARHGRRQHPRPAPAAAQPWVRPINEMDVYQRFYQLA